MKVLVVATNATPPGLGERALKGTHQRVDYLELAKIYRTSHIDYNLLSSNPTLAWFEQLARCDFRLAAKVSQFALHGGYDLVMSLSERVGIPLSLLLDRRIAHMVIFHHGMSHQKLRLIRLLGLQRWWDVVAAISHAEAEGMRSYLGLSPERVVALHTPVDTQFYRPSAPSRGNEDFIQSLGLSYRDYPTLINAMRSLPHIPCQLRVGSTWVAGRGKHDTSTLPANVSLRPFVQPEALRDCYAESRFIVVPIKPTTQWSAGCTSVQAAQAMARPVIATRTPGLAEYVIDGETGLLVEQGNDRAMAEAIQTLWQDPVRVQAMGRAAREFVHTHHSLDFWLEKVSQLADQAVQIRARRLISGARRLTQHRTGISQGQPLRLPIRRRQSTMNHDS